MLLLPDIRSGENVLSIQSPYTINGDIVTDIDIELHISFNGIILLKTEKGTCYRFPIEKLSYNFSREMARFIVRYGYNACIEGYRDIHDWSDYSFNNYINNIKDQCECIGLRYNYDHYITRINALKADLRRQGRLSCECTISLDEINYNRTMYNNISFRNNGHIIFDFDNDSSSGHRSNFDIVIDEPVVDELKRTYIHDYNYKPEYIYHYMPNEDKDTTALFGIELEVAGNENEPDREETVKKCIQIINGSDDDSESLIYSTKDSTVQIELDTMPASFEFHKNKMNYKELFKYLDEIGYKGHDCDKAGLHIHVNRKYLGKSELVQQLTISKILYILEKFNDEICIIARRNNSYSKFVGKDEVNKSLNELYNKYHSTGKRVALNLQHKDTIEFRMFRSTLKYETFILTLEFVKDIVDYAKSINIEQIELIKWSDLMDTFSDELKGYYNIRLEKEKNKEEKKDTTVDSNTYSNYPIISSVDFNIDEIVRQLNEIQERFIVPTGCDMPSLAEYSYLWNNAVDNARNPEEELKKKIKSLKKRINNSNNYLEKKNLQQELLIAQKELKKLKKKKLNNNTNTTT